MSSRKERGEFFELLATLLFYLVSGYAHTGYLFNYDGNPLHDFVLSLMSHCLTIEFEC